ncbi:uncharacterized protein [Cherax quadricarinatus]
MLAVLVLLSVLGAALPLLPPPASQALLKKYAFIKIMSSCLGEESVEQWMEQFRSACQRCYASPTADISPDFQDILDELRLQSYRRPVYVPIPVYQPLQQPQQGAPQSGQLPQQGHLPQYSQSQLPQHSQLLQPGQSQLHRHKLPQHGKSQLPQYSQPLQQGQLPQYEQPQHSQLVPPGQPQHSKPQYSQQLQTTLAEQTHLSHFPSAQYNPFQSSGASRSRREAGLSPEHLKNLKTLIIAKISNITCVLRELKLLASNNLPNYSYIGKELLSLPVEDGLKADLGEALQECRDLSLCLPVHKDKHPINKELGTVLSFLKCMARKKVAVCMKADLQKHAEKTGWGGEDSSYLFLASSGLISGREHDPLSLMEDIGDMIFSTGPFDL